MEHYTRTCESDIVTIDTVGCNRRPDGVVTYNSEGGRDNEDRSKSSKMQSALDRFSSDTRTISVIMYILIHLTTLRR